MTWTRKILLSAGAAGLVLALLIYALFLRPTARAERLCRDAGFHELPASARDLHIERRGAPFTTQRLYLRFQATAEETASFFERSGIDPNEEPGSMQVVRFGAKSPPWMQWSDLVRGRIYHINRPSASVTLAIDDDTHTIYLAMYEYRAPWLRRLLERCGIG